MPRTGNDWGTCDPADPRNRRRRASILVEAEGTRVLVDTGPDLRNQLLDAGVGTLDAVLYTHDHADHSHGIDDLRQLFQNAGRPVDCFGTEATWSILKRRFEYVFEGTEFYQATANAHVLPTTLRVGPLTITGFCQNHGNVDSTGYRFECDGFAIAYSTDVKAIPEGSARALTGLDLWIVDALRRHPHPTHSHLEQTLGWIERYRPRRAVLTHLDNSMDFETLASALPPSVGPAYDGQVIEIEKC